MCSRAFEVQRRVLQVPDLVKAVSRCSEVAERLRLPRHAMSAPARGSAVMSGTNELCPERPTRLCRRTKDLVLPYSITCIFTVPKEDAS